MSLSDDYANLLIMQYAGKPKAKAEIKAYAEEYERLYNFALSWFEELDIDKAWGHRLDLIGKIVGIDRIVEKGYAKKYFGFEGATNAKGFGKAPMFNAVRDSAYSDTELSDEQFRFFIKSKIAKNITSAKMANDGDRLSLQETVQYLFEGLAYVDDNKNMTLTLYIDESYDEDDIRIIMQEGLLPSPQGVGYKFVNNYSQDGTFGFLNNPNAKGFGEGKFARKVIL